MIEPGKLGIFNDLAALCSLVVKYRALIPLVKDRDAFVAQGQLSLEGDDRRRRRVQQIRLSRQFPGVLAELEHTKLEDVSELVALLRFYSGRQEELSDEVRRGVHLVSDYHLALRALISGESRFRSWLPDALVNSPKGEGASRRIGRWVREKYGLESQSQVWKLDIRWIRGS